MFLCGSGQSEKSLRFPGGIFDGCLGTAICRLVPDSCTFLKRCSCWFGGVSVVCRVFSFVCCVVLFSHSYIAKEKDFAHAINIENFESVWIRVYFSYLNRKSFCETHWRARFFSEKNPYPFRN